MHLLTKTSTSTTTTTPKPEVDNGNTLTHSRREQMKNRRPSHRGTRRRQRVKSAEEKETVELTTEIAERPRRIKKPLFRVHQRPTERPSPRFSSRFRNDSVEITTTPIYAQTDKSPEDDNATPAQSSHLLRPQDVVSNRKPARKIPVGSVSQRLRELALRRKNIGLVRSKLAGSTRSAETKSDGDTTAEDENISSSSEAPRRRLRERKLRRRRLRGRNSSELLSRESENSNSKETTIMTSGTTNVEKRVEKKESPTLPKTSSSSEEPLQIMLSQPRPATPSRRPLDIAPTATPVKQSTESNEDYFYNYSDEVNRGGQVNPNKATTWRPDASFSNGSDELNPQSIISPNFERKFSSMDIRPPSLPIESFFQLF